MKRFLSITLAIALLLGLGSLAVLARPGGSSEPAAPQAAVQVESSQQTASQPAAPAAQQTQNKVNVIALPLNNSAQFVSAGKSFDADGLAALVGSGVLQVLMWDPSLGASGAYRTYYPAVPPLPAYGDNFALTVGGAYRLVLSSDYVGTGVSFVGDVPALNSVSFVLKRPLEPGGCIINDISIPLNRSDLTNADQLAADIGSVSQVLEWSASNPDQVYRTWYPANPPLPGYGDNFNVYIGYPYRLCLQSNGLGAEQIWR